MNRQQTEKGREGMKTVNRIAIGLLFSMATAMVCHGAEHPNIILMMADDLGYGDTGFNGNEDHQDATSRSDGKDGVKLTHFYAGGPVCSPTRGTFLTGRHYYRYGIWSANVGHLPNAGNHAGAHAQEQGLHHGAFRQVACGNT